MQVQELVYCIFNIHSLITKVNKLHIMRYSKYIFAIVFAFFIISSNAQDKKTKRQINKIDKKLKNWDSYFNKWSNLGNIKVDSFSHDRQAKKLQLFFSKELSYVPIRESIINEVTHSLLDHFGKKYKTYHFELFSNKKNIIEYVPNIYRQSILLDSTRLPKQKQKISPLISRFYPLKPQKGLFNSNLAIWHSHGRYYEAKLDRWEWQRARLHTTVEDMFPMTFVLDYLEPMLENAGATVFIPRERDINRNEVIVDNDLSTGNSFIEINTSKIDTLSRGFMMNDTLFNKENPFLLGTYLRLNSKENSIKYIPDIPESGEYAVYISYGNQGSKNVKYILNYAGGSKVFVINQTKGAGTWIYLDKFYFNKGIDAKKGSLMIESDNPISTDAVRFGGGMGNVARRPATNITTNAWSLKAYTSPTPHDEKKGNDSNPDEYSWKTSGLPRYLEAARYYLQYSGMPDSTVYSLSKGKNDYNDDYKSRGEWVNYLMGSPNGPTNHNKIKGLQIPIDLALAFHTDAGVTPLDSIIGTLAIYNSNEPKTIFPSGQSKMVNRDLVDIVQTQIVEDIVALYNSKWTRRGIWNKSYSEAWRPNTPVMLLELLSHQNLTDMSFGLDDRFKFDVSRAIYKGILKFLAYQNNKEYIVQPLVVDHFAIQIIQDKKIRLSWSVVEDPLESTAIPTAYMVYKRIGNQGFDQGIMTKNPFFEMDIERYNEQYSFKVTALNDGGESFPSEILSVGIKQDAPLALVVNAFDRISGPAIINSDGISSVAYWEDMGVAYKREIGLTGMPYDFNRYSPWLDDDNPGWGASFSDWEGKVIAGNSFDYPFVHGKAIMNNGYSFVSVSDEVFKKKFFNISPYKFVDIIFGEEKTTKARPIDKTDQYQVYDQNMITKIKEIADSKGNIFISGAYIGTDLMETKDSITQKSVAEILHYKWRTNYASKLGEVYATDYAKDYFNGTYRFNTSIDSSLYMVEAPDGIEPVGDGSVTAFRYKDSGVSAGVIYKGKYQVVVLGFPFETIKNQSAQNNLMKQIIMFLEE